MTKRNTIAIGLSALALAIAGQGIAGKASEEVARAAKTARADAKKAAKALSRHEANPAIRFAEGAVALAPRSAEYRMLLGQSYLQAGRFASAATAFADVLALDGGNAKAALNLALAQIATGDWQAARGTLDTHGAGIAPADRGLALALAGDAPSAVQLLMETARRPGADAKLRQNLALALALSGQWQSAKVVAATDLSPADVDARLQQWAVFAQPTSASDQVASLLGVQPAADPGQPMALALNAPVAAPMAVAVAEPAPAQPEIAAVEAAAPEPALTPAAMAIAFAPRQEMVQPLPVPMLKADAAPARIALAKAVMTARVQPMQPLIAAPARRLLASPTRTGNWYVQLGAYDNPAVARDAWGRFVRRGLFNGRVPQGATVKVQGGELYRLSVGGFARGDADALCRRHRVQGGACFVRAGAGDQVARWSRAKPVQLAMR